MNRFYIKNIAPKDGLIILEDQEEIHHIKNVLKLKEGEIISLFDGKGNEVEGRIKQISSKEIMIGAEHIREIKRQGPKLILACAMPKRSKFESIIEKATELGVDEIIPLQTKRTEVILKDERIDKKIERFEKIVISASKQSKRAMLTKIHPPMDFKSALELLKKNSVIIIPSLLGEQKNLIEVLSNLKSASSISFFIGPEGDFTPQEYQLAQNFGAIAVTLGPNILRVETAALSVLAVARLFYSHP